MTKRTPNDKVYSEFECCLIECLNPFECAQQLCRLHDALSARRARHQPLLVPDVFLAWLDGQMEVATVTEESVVEREEFDGTSEATSEQLAHAYAEAHDSVAP